MYDFQSPPEKIITYTAHLSPVLYVFAVESISQGTCEFG